MQACVYQWGRVPPYLYLLSEWPNTWLGLTSYPNKVKLSYRYSKTTLHNLTLGNISSTYNEGCTSRSIHNNGIPKRGKHISNGGKTTYTNDTLEYLLKLQIHQHSLLTRKVFSLFHSHQQICTNHHHEFIIIVVSIIIVSYEMNGSIIYGI